MFSYIFVAFGFPNIDMKKEYDFLVLNLLVGIM